MLGPRTRRTRRRPALLAAGLVALLLVVGWFVLRDDDRPDALSGLRDAAAVEAATEDDGDVAVRLRPGTTARQLPAVLADAPEDADRTTLALGRASLEVEDGATPDPELLQAFVALSAVRAPGGTLAIAPLSADERVAVEVRRPEQAAPLARELLARLTPGGRPFVGIDRVEVRLAGAPTADVPPVTLRRFGGRGAYLAAGVLDAAVALTTRRPRVSTNGDDADLRARATGIADAEPAWRAAARALDRTAAERGDVMLYVDVSATVAGRQGTRALLSGPADDDPGRALAFLRALPASTTDAFAATDRGFARVTAPTPRVAEAAAAAARSAGVRRLSLEWPAPATGSSGTLAGADTGSSGTAAGGDADERSGRDATSAARLEDAPDVLLGLLPGVARAHRLGIDEVRWTADADADVDVDAALQVAPPAWIDAQRPVTDQPEPLRRFARAVRAIGWPGTARLVLPLGRGSCKGFPSAQGVAAVRSTTDGRARSAEPVGTCTDPAAVAAARRAWNATAG